ncbi:hypothetical protein HN419_05705 [Candidatus Woesearchaeota archaeon]|jgi:hypothetical protein|nr:hypothetical protein [Candidatus Woesearchaeota archaeon]MBT3537635.1 hypothetical protein [Candidatus Woesearchaeota archaeon]MBT4698431.1 hypothetical protein [Candidatus Woesearchaeota archaeon]MBT4716660.1 hypothetical protein [Candidatus Woesearchaeota archaeon]MBT7105304.1 hypothetical protein [Candidatus Woesearchaeota archaeon]
MLEPIVDRDPRSKEAPRTGEVVYLCVRQLSQRSRLQSLPGSIRPEGWGDCSICTPDEVNNPNCAGYRRLKLHTFYVGLPEPKYD